MQTPVHSAASVEANVSHKDIPNASKDHLGLPEVVCALLQAVTRSTFYFPRSCIN